MDITPQEIAELVLTGPTAPGEPTAFEATILESLRRLEAGQDTLKTMMTGLRRNVDRIPGGE